MKKKYKPIIVMQCDIPFNHSGQSRSSIGRIIHIEREMPCGGEQSSDLDVNISISWKEGDRRDQDILAGLDRQQNIYTDVRYILDAFISLFPELLIKYTTD